MIIDFAKQGVRVAFIAAGSAACHSVIGDVHGVCYTWGRNEKGQLGLGDTMTRNVPTAVGVNLAGKKVISGSAGKHHTVVLTESGETYSFGCNTFGQCGTGSVKKVPKGTDDLILSPERTAVPLKCTKLACGGEFTMWVSNGKLYSAGLPQYGQLGHGTDNCYNMSDSSVKMVFEPQPIPKLIAVLAEKTITQLACGHNHTVVVASDGGVWTWGFGGYGRLGHKVQQDEMKPRLVETLTPPRMPVLPDAVVAAGSTSTFCTMIGNMMCAWGKLKPSGDNMMYPTPMQDLAGWNIHSFACGATTFAAAATYGSEKSTITWGHSGGYSELGYGEGGKKSSANPDKCLALEGVDCYQVAMGVGHSLFLVDPEHEKVKNAPVWEPTTDKDEDAPVAGGNAVGTKRKAPAAKGGKGKKK